MNATGAAFERRDDGSLDATDPLVAGFAWSLDGRWIALRGVRQEPGGLVVPRDDVSVVPLEFPTDEGCAVRLDDPFAAREILFMAGDRLLVARDDLRGAAAELVHELPDGGLAARREHPGTAIWPPQRSRDGARAFLRWSRRGGSTFALIDDDARVLHGTDERTLLGRVSAAFLADRNPRVWRAVLDPDGVRLAVAVPFTNEVDTTRMAFLDLASDDAARSGVTLPWVGDLAFVAPDTVVHVIAYDLRLRVALLDRGPIPRKTIEVPTGLVGTRRGFALAPDGDAVLVVTNDRERPVALHLVRLDTGEATVLRTFSRETCDAVAAWTPGGEVLLACAEESGRITLARGEALEVAAEVPTERYTRLFALEPSPCGRWVALHWTEDPVARRLRLVPLDP